MKTKQITELLFQMVDAYGKLTNNRPHRAVQDLNSGYCYMVATLAQHILKEKYRIDVNMVSHPHHCLLEYEGEYYDTIYPTGYPDDPCKVWKLEEAKCRSTLDLLEYGEVGILNPHPRQIVLVEWMCEEFGVSKPDYYQHMLEWYDTPDAYRRFKWKGYPDFTKTTYRRLMTRYRRRHHQYFDEPLTKYSMGWMADFIAYPEDLWVTLRVTDYRTWLKNVIRTRYPSYEEVMVSCFGEGVYDRPNIQIAGRLSTIAEPGLSKLRGCIPTVQMIDDAGYQKHSDERGTVELEMHWGGCESPINTLPKLDLSTPLQLTDLSSGGDDNVLTLGSPDMLKDGPEKSEENHNITLADIALAIAPRSTVETNLSTGDGEKVLTSDSPDLLKDGLKVEGTNEEEKTEHNVYVGRKASGVGSFLGGGLVGGLIGYGISKLRNK